MIAAAHAPYGPRPPRETLDRLLVDYAAVGNRSRESDRRDRLAERVQTLSALSSCREMEAELSRELSEALRRSSQRQCEAIASGDLTPLILAADHLLMQSALHRGSPQILHWLSRRDADWDTADEQVLRGLIASLRRGLDHKDWGWRNAALAAAIAIGNAYPHWIDHPWAAPAIAPWIEQCDRPTASDFQALIQQLLESPHE